MHFDEPDLDDVTLAAVMAALSDPVRVAIVRELACRGEARAGRSSSGSRRPPARITSRCCARPGLTHTRAEGTHRYVSLRRDEVDARFPGLLGAVLAAAEREAAYRGPFLIAELAILTSCARVAVAVWIS